MPTDVAALRAAGGQGRPLLRSTEAPTEPESERTRKVECYAGTRYPERPTALAWQGNRLAVDNVERDWQTPGERHFTVRTRAGRFHLTYREGEDLWLIEQA